MKNSVLYVSLLAGAALSFSSLIGMDSEKKKSICFIYEQATAAHIDGVVELINKEAINDSNKIVVVPKLFRKKYVESAINAGRLFVTTNSDGNVVGYKKLFCIDNDEELKDILENEFRNQPKNLAAGNEVGFAFHKIQQQQKEVSAEDAARIFKEPATYVYTGADFTHPDYREKNINSELTKFALGNISARVQQHIKTNNSKNLIVGYGLTKENAGDEKDLLGGRSDAIIRQFEHPINQMIKDAGYESASFATLLRYHAFKPSFDPESTECKPLPDDKAIPGYGCFIVYRLEPNS